jgi:hypothetical protein
MLKKLRMKLPPRSRAGLKRPLCITLAEAGQMRIFAFTFFLMCMSEFAFVGLLPCRFLGAYKKGSLASLVPCLFD